MVEREGAFEHGVSVPLEVSVSRRVWCVCVCACICVCVCVCVCVCGLTFMSASMSKTWSAPF